MCIVRSDEAVGGTDYMKNNTLSNFKKIMEESMQPEKQTCGVIYSTFNEDKFERFCEKNFLIYQEGMEENYRRDKVFQWLFRCALYITMFCAVAKLSELGMRLYGYRVLRSSFSQMLAAIICLIIGESVVRMVIRKLSPLSVQIDRQKRFRSEVVVYYYPLFEFQEALRKAKVKRIEINTKDSIMDVEYRDAMGGKHKKKLVLYGGYERYCKDGCIDFTCLDERIRQMGNNRCFRLQKI